MTRPAAWKISVALLVLSVSAALVAWSSLRPQAPAASASSSVAAATEAPAVLARVDGEPITAAEVEGALGASLDRLEQQIYEMKRQQLDRLIGEKLLAREAAKRGVSVDSLVSSEITAKAGEVTDQEVERFYEANKSRLPQQADIKSQIRRYLREQREGTRRDDYITSLRGATTVEVSLDPPPVRRFEVTTEGAPSRGRADAPITIVEFSDFHCPFCKRVQPTLTQVLERYPDKVRLVYRHLPIDQLHPAARAASEAAQCADDQGRFWPYHDKLYERSPDASPETLKAIASETGLDMPAFERCLATAKHKAAVQASVDEAERFGATGTPAFFINGRLLSGAQPLETFVRIIEEELSGKVQTKK